MALHLRATYLVLVLFYTILFKFSIGVAAKDAILVGLSGLLFLVYNRQCLEFLNRHAGIYLLFAVLAAIAIPITLLHGSSVDIVGRELLGSVVQPCLVIMCTYVLSVTAGLRFTVGVFLGATALSGVFVVLQYLDFDAAWSARRVLGTLQPQPGHITDLVAGQNRPVGLSFTAIMYSYQLISAYVIGNVLYRHGLMPKKTYVMFVGAVVVISIANGTRSLLIGIALQELLQNPPRMRVSSILGLAVLGVVGFAAYSYLDATGSRVTSVADASAVGRTMLYQFGFRLAGDFPFGIGWGFDPAEMAWVYWDFLSELTRADAAFRLELHNAFLNFYMNYGLFGVVAILVAYYLNPGFFNKVLLYFSSYLAHAFFHNDGFFLTDDFNWFAFAILLFVCDRYGALAGGRRQTQAEVSLPIAVPKAVPGRG